MATKTYTEFVKNQVVEGYENGFKFEDFKKGDTVSIFYSGRPSVEPELVEGKIVTVERAKNAAGKDTIRNITVDIGKVNFTVHGHTQIKYFLFKKNEVEQTELIAPAKEKIEAPIDGETMIIDRAWGEKNPTVKKCMAEGWLFLESKWNREKNMYQATLAKS